MSCRCEMFLYTFQTENLTHAQKQDAAPQKRPLALFAEGHPSPQLPSDLPPQLWQQLALSPWLLSPWLLEYPALRSLAADACLLYWHYSPHRLSIHRSPPHPPPPPGGQAPPPASYLQCQGAQIECSVTAGSLCTPHFKHRYSCSAHSICSPH